MTQKTPRRFQLRFWPTLGTLVGLAILISLGTWQLTRYLEKLDLEAQRSERLDEDIVEVESLDAFEANAGAYNAVAVRGRLDPRYTFLFKHRVHDGKPGYWLGGVLRFAEGDGGVLVNRGWIHREHAAEVATQAPPTQTRTYLGLVHAPNRIVADAATRQALEAGEVELQNNVVEWDTYDLEAIADALPYETPADPMIVVLGPEHSREPYPVASFDYVTEPYLTSERHLGYVLFWYATAVALLSMYLAAGFGYLGSSRRPRRTDADA